jgi:translocation and assembly module TamA
MARIALPGALLGALLSTLLPQSVAAAERIDYTVKVRAPAPLDALLEKNLDLMRWRGNPRVDADQLQRLVKATPDEVKALVATEGYYTPQVKVRLDPGAGTRVVEVSVDPGKPVRVGAVDLVLRGFAPGSADGKSTPFDAAALKNSWSLSQGKIFRQPDWEAAKRALLRQVMANRYPRAQLVDSGATVDPDTHRAALRVVLASGPEMRLGALRIEGLKRYPASIVTNLNQIKPGDEYSEAALQALQSRLQDSGYFSAVDVSADLSGVLDQLPEANPAAQPGQAPVPAGAQATIPATTLPLVVRVTENKVKNVSVGLGYSTNTGNRAQLTYDDLRLFGLKFKSGITFESKKQAAHGDFYFPTTAKGYNDSIGAAFERSDIAGEVTSVATVGAKRAWGSPLLERNITLEYLSERKTVANRAPVRSQSLPLTYGITKRRLDNLLFPSKGYVLHGQLGGALLPILTDQAFVRASAKFINYRPVGKNGTLILRAEAGALGSKQKAGVPSTYLFRAGGDQSVRGYAYQELGVRDGDATVGGRYLAAASAEYQYWFKPAWGAAVFYDAGNAADSVKDLKPKSGYGVGARWKSPVGPINVDAAYGHAVKKYRLHFSLGFTF